MTVRLYGDWKKAGIILQQLSVNLHPLVQAKMYEHGELILERLIEHIESQDLPWQPLSRTTISRKGHDVAYVETGWLLDNLGVRRVKNSNGATIFVGASPWKRHKPSGLKFSDLMIYQEYGTATIPPRPLMRPTWEELRPLIQKEMQQLIQDILNGRVK